MVSYESIKKDKTIQTYISWADDSLRALGYTEHSFAHVTKVAECAANILLSLGYDEQTAELGRIAGYLHDIGNLVNRVDHSQSGALLAFRLLDKMGMEPENIATVVSAIGNHDEGTGVAVNPVAAALIIADKTDVRRSRVRFFEDIKSDIHDRVNYSVENAVLEISKENKKIELSLTVDTQFSSVMEYFDIFLTRMKMCSAAAVSLGVGFSLIVNGQKLL